MTGPPHLQPTEYYDQRNADEERVGQVCMDDLASEGLLLIRMEPDDRGRYGFIVKVRNFHFRTSNTNDPVPSFDRAMLGRLMIPYRFFSALSNITIMIIYTALFCSFRVDLMKEWLSLSQRSLHNLQ